MAKRLTNEAFIDKLKRMFLNYDISKVEYVNMHTNIILSSIGAMFYILFTKRYKNTTYVATKLV